MTDEVFVPFPKISRLRRDCVVTEKIDGTNASIHIQEDGTVRAASRTRWITPESDNYGFARWVDLKKDELRELGVGSHFGEWWGEGIQRRYDQDRKHFSLFNVGRWTGPNAPALPACVSVVPVLHQGPFSDEGINLALDTLRSEGSVAAPGFMDPEGIVVFLAASRHLYKITLDGDAVPKSLAA